MSGQSPAPAAAPPPASLLLARHSVARSLAQVSPLAQTRIKAFVLDTLAVGVAGAASAYAQRVRAFATAHAGGAGPAAVFGFGDRLTPRAAAFCNAFLVHCQEFDCVHEAAVLHPFTVVTPVVLAQASLAAMDGKTFMAAVAAGVDIAAGLGVAATTPIKFFRPAVYGLFGAVGALARARGLDEETLVHAFGYALALASGTMQAHSEGTPALAIQIAHAARCAFDAVDLAQAGLPGPRGAIDGGHGLLALFETGHDLSRLIAPLDGLARVEEVSWKPYPTGRAAHGGLDMMRTAVREGVRAVDVVAVEIVAPPLICHLVGRPVRAPLEVNYARLCLPYLAAAMLVRGKLDLTDFSDDARADAEVMALAARITVRASDVVDPAAFTPQSVRITLRSGAVRDYSLTDLPGGSARPLSLEEQHEKVRRCLAFSRPRDGAQMAATLIAAVEDLEQCADVATLANIAGASAEGGHGHP